MGHVILGDGGVHGQLDAQVLVDLRLGPAVTVTVTGLEGLLVGGHGLGDHTHVQVEADPGDVPGLLPAQQIAGAADLQVLHGHLHARPQVGIGGNGAQPLQGGLGQGPVGRVQEVGVGALAPAAHAPAQLMELAQPHAVGPVDNEGVGVRHVQAGLHNRGAHQHIDLLAPEVVNDPLQARLAHLPVGDGDPRLGHRLSQAGGDGVNVLHPVVDVEDLTLAQQLTADGGTDLPLLVGAHVSEDGVAVLGRGGQGGHLPQAGHRHLQGARNGRGRHGQDIDVGAQGLESLLVLHPEALLLVDNDQPQVLEAHPPGDQAVRADDDVDAPVGQARQDLGGGGGVLEAGELGHPHGETGVALGEGLGVLAHEQGGGREDGDLLAVGHGLEGGAHGDLGLAVADVAADEPVHRLGPLHVRLDLVDGDQLVGGLGVGEGLLQLGLPGRVGAEGVAGGGGAGGVKAHELPGDLPHGPPGPGLGPGPVRPAHPVQGGGVAADVLGHLVQGVGGHQEPVAGLAAPGGGVLDDDVLAGGGAPPAADPPAQELDEAPHAVLGVDDEVAGAQRERVDAAAGAAGGQGLALAGGGAGPPGQVGLGDEGQAQSLGDEAVAGAGPGDAHDAVAAQGPVGGDFAQVGGLVQAGDYAGGHAAVGQQGGHAPAGAGPVGGDDDAPAPARQGPQVGDGLVEPAGVAARIPQGQFERVRAGLEGGEVPPAAAGGQGQVAGLPEGGEGGGGQVHGGPAPGGGRGPGGGEEFGGRGHEVLGAPTQALGLQGHDEAIADQVEQRHHAPGQDGGEGLHALAPDPLGDPAQHVGGAGDGVGQFPGPGAHGVGEQQLAAGGGGDGADLLDGALVGDGEGGDGLDLVAEEVHAHRAGQGGREDVEDAAAHGELAAVLHHVDPRVGGVGQAGGGGLEPDVQAGGEADGLELAQALDNGGQQGPHGGDENADGAAGGVGGAAGAGIGVLGVSQAPQDRQAGGHRVGARGEPLVREGLPGGEDGDVGRGRVAGQGGGQGLGPAGGGGHHEQRSAAGRPGAGGPLLSVGHGRQDGGPGSGGDDDGAVGALAAAGVGDEVGNDGVGEQRGQEGGQTHAAECRACAAQPSARRGRPRAPDNDRSRRSQRVLPPPAIRVAF